MLSLPLLLLLPFCFCNTAPKPHPQAIRPSSIQAAKHSKDYHGLVGALTNQSTAVVARYVMCIAARKEYNCKSFCNKVYLLLHYLRAAK